MEARGMTGMWSNNQDWFKVEITETGVLKAELTVPNSLDLTMDIFLLDNGQPKLVSDDDDDNSSHGQDLVSEAFLEAGTYYIHINDENNDNTSDQTYNMCLSFSANPFEINHSLETAILIPKDTCFTDNIWGENNLFNNSNDGDNDQDWFKVEIKDTCDLKIDHRRLILILSYIVLIIVLL
ncbi:MAG: PPC domain-containing protein [Marinoscillum sp.]